MPLRILLADDDNDLRFLIEMSLTDSGYDVKCVTNGQEAVDAATGERFDVILMDADMPVMSGFEAYEKLRAQDDTSKIPVIFLTARPPDENVRNQSGAFHYILKPFDADTLPEIIRKIANK